MFRRRCNLTCCASRVRLHWCKASGAQTRRSVVYLFPSLFLSVYVPSSPSCSITLSLSAVFPCQIFPGFLFLFSLCWICGCCRYYEHCKHALIYTAVLTFVVSKKIVLLFSKGARNWSKVTVKTFILLQKKKKTFLFQINAVLLNFLFIKESWKNKWIMVSAKILSSTTLQNC